MTILENIECDFNPQNSKVEAEGPYKPPHHASYRIELLLRNFQTPIKSVLVFFRHFERDAFPETGVFRKGTIHRC